MASTVFDKPLDEQIGNVATSASIGTFSTQADLETALDTLLSGAVSDGVKAFQFTTSAAFSVFGNGVTYFGTLYKSGSTTTFSHASFRTLNSTKEYVGRRISTGGWTFDEIALNTAIANQSQSRTKLTTQDVLSTSLAPGLYYVTSASNVPTSTISGYLDVTARSDQQTTIRMVKWRAYNSHDEFVNIAPNSSTWTGWQKYSPQPILVDFTDESVTSGAVTIAYPTGCTSTSHKYFIQPIYKSGALLGWSAVIQAQPNNLIAYIRQGTTTPADDSKVRFTLLCVPV